MENLYLSCRKAILLTIVFSRRKLTQPEYRNLYASFTDYKSFDEVKMVVGKTGAAEVPTDPMPPEATDMIVVLKPQSEWKTKNLTTN